VGAQGGPAQRREAGSGDARDSGDLDSQRDGRQCEPGYIARGQTGFTSMPLSAGRLSWSFALRNKTR